LDCGASQAQLGEINAARHNTLHADTSMVGRNKPHAWFDAELSSTKGLIGRRELDENSWLYHMNQYIMPVCRHRTGVDLGNLKPKNELWAGTQFA